jgi:chromate transporter
MTYKQLFLQFFKFGLFTFGGGYAMIPMMSRVFVYDKKLIDEHTMTDYIAISQIAPGMIAINMANVIGRHFKGKRGSFVAVSGVALPSFLIISLIAALIPNILDIPVVLKAVQGIVIAVIVLLSITVINLLKYLKQYWYLVTYAGVVSIVVFFFQVPIVAVILSAIVFGSIHAWILSKKEVPHA